MTRTTDDRSDPGLSEINPDTNMQAAYLVLSEEERARGFVRAYHDSYVHHKCGGVTRMGRALSETYARQPSFYGATYCAICRDHFPVGKDGEFIWEGTNTKVGT